jgi:hypothetical protein
MAVEGSVAKERGIVWQERKTVEARHSFMAAVF